MASRERVSRVPRRLHNTVTELPSEDDLEGRPSRHHVPLARRSTRGQGANHGSTKCNGLIKRSWGIGQSRGPDCGAFTDGSSELASTIYTPATRRKIDWRFEICHFLKLDENALDDEIIDELQKASAKVEEAERVLQNLKSAALQDPLRYQIVHHVTCSDSYVSVMYMEEPRVIHAGSSRSHLSGSEPVSNMQLYLERNKDVSFLVHRYYTCCKDRYQPMNRFRLDREPDTRLASMLEREHIEIVSVDLESRLASLSDVVFQGIPHPKFQRAEIIEDEDDESDSDDYVNRRNNSRDDLGVSYPYLWFYHRRLDISEAIDHLELEETDWENLNLFCGYIRTRMSDEWATVDKLISNGEITAKYIRYVYIPGEIVIWTPPGSPTTKLQAFSVTNWLEPPSVSIPTASWSFDGKFQRDESPLRLGNLPSSSHAFKIYKLNPHPKKFSDESLGVTERLRQRGEMVWRCRDRNYVCYKSFVDDGIKTPTDSRFMIDVKILQQMHPKEHKATNQDDLGTEHLSQVNPPLGDEFIMCLPPTIIGFNMQKKEWISLDIDLIEDVTWNTDAFKHLVIDKRMKELVQAVVTNQIRAAESTDLVRGKGSGLTMLLHGGPGTGKTLTAESVAEVAKKPLYRVTCGDIGTKAEEVEKYLETIFLLGKTWDCVVLLDEADVFLEQRSIVSLERNALVSVFLRMLEYYDGILILTSNRVGIFDEAFKSRIQLNLRYQNLDRDQRKEIWTNFIHRLECLAKDRAGLELDAKDIYNHIDNLAAPGLNGREIRNAISTARQLAKYRDEPLGYNHLQSVIAEAEKFDRYLTELHEGFSADERQNDKGER